KTMDEVGSALIAIGLVLCAVFIPTAFITGISGAFYKQFALTITASTIISALVSLTLSPALAALFLRPPAAGLPPAARSRLFHRRDDPAAGREPGADRPRGAQGVGDPAVAPGRRPRG